MTQITCNINNHMAADDGRKTADHQSELVNKLLQIADENVLKNTRLADLNVSPHIVFR